MKNSRRFFLVLAFAVFFLTLGKVKAAPAGEFISPSEIHPGMIGYGKTVFHGTRIETFKVVVLGVLPKALANTDLILVRIQSPYLEKNKIGLVAGMSGSPVYFNGRLAGAVAYGWPFTPEPLAGITPIEPMLSSGREGTGETAGGAPSFIQIKNLPASIRKFLPGDSRISSLSLEPLEIPVSASGFDTQNLARLQSEFPMFRMIAGGAGSGLTSSANPGPLEPGQSVGAALMEGDFSLEAAGTLTYRNGDKILAFGHPFLFLGDVNLPLYETYVHSVLPSLQLPFKFASPLREIGKVSEDRLYAIGGTLGESARMVPLDIEVNDETRRVRHQYHVWIIRNPDFTPRLTAAALEQAVSATSKMLGEATARLDYEIDFKNHPPLHVKNTVLSETSIAGAVEAELLRPMTQVLENDFEKTTVSGIRVKISIRPDLAAATLQRMILSKHHLTPGEPLWATLFLKPYNKPVLRKKFRVRIPSDIQGTVAVGAAGGMDADDLRKTMLQPPAEPLNVNQLIRQLQSQPPNNALVIRLRFPRRGIHWAGENFRNFPQAYADLLKAAGSDPLDFHPDGGAVRYEMPWVVRGTDIQDVTIGPAKEAPSPELKPPHFPSLPPTAPTQPPIIPQPGSSSAADTNFPPDFSADLNPPDSSPSLPDSNSNSENNETEKNQKAGLVSLSSLKDWQEGTLQNLAVSPEGNLLLGPQTDTSASFDENVILAEAKSGNNLFIGTANPGKIYKISPLHAKSVFFDPQKIMISALAALPDGGLLAGAEGGTLFQLSPSGKIKRFWTLQADYIWQILLSGSTAYLAAGSPQGRIYALDTASPSPSPVLLYTSSQSHILCLYASAAGSLYAGTANEGLLLSLDGAGEARTLYDFGQSAILSLGAAPDGKLIIGTAGGGVYLLDSGGRVQKIAGLPDKLVAWVGARGDKILAATGIPARLYAVKPGQAPALLWDGKPEELAALKGAPGDAEDFSASGTRAVLLRISGRPAASGRFISKILDAGKGKAVWGDVSWEGLVPEGAKLTVQSRAGNSPVPDQTWSDWSAPYAQSGDKLSGPAGRYLQFKVQFASQNPGAVPRLEAVRYFWKPQNTPPSLEISFPAAGDIVGPKTELEGKIRDESGGTMKVTVWRESENGSPNPEKVFTQLYRIDPSIGEKDMSIPLDGIKTEGPMQLRLVVSDNSRTDPAAAFSSQTVIKDLVYDSSVPSLSITNVHAENDITYMEGNAGDSTSYIKEVDFKLDDGPWLESAPQGGFFDRSRTHFTIALDHGLNAEEIEIRALDGADNEKTLKKNLKDLTGFDFTAGKPKKKPSGKNNTEKKPAPKSRPSKKETSEEKPSQKKPGPAKTPGG